MTGDLFLTIIPYFILEQQGGKVKCFESVNVCDVKRRSTYVTYSTYLRNPLANMMFPFKAVIKA
jgi:hypothetical protein